MFSTVVAARGGFPLGLVGSCLCRGLLDLIM